MTNIYTKSRQRFNDMRSAIYRAEEAIVRSPDMEQDRDILTELSQSFIREMQALVYVFGGDGSYLEDTVDGIRDDLSNAFNDAINERDERREARRDPTERGYSKADWQREAAE